MKKISWAFVPTPNEVKTSPAWRVLSLYARRMIETIELEWWKSSGDNNGRLIVTYKDLQMHCCTANKNVLVEAQRELVALRLITFVPGRFGPRGAHEPNMFGLTYFPSHNGVSATHDWKEIKTVEEAQAIQAAVKKRRGKSDWLKTKQLAKETQENGAHATRTHIQNLRATHG
jgi:hypothetical protein